MLSVCNRLLLLLSFITIITTKRNIFPPVSALSNSPLSQFPFRNFQFATNNVCIHPKTFYYESIQSLQNDKSEERNHDKQKNNDNESMKSIMEFTMKNVPGDGDCMFLAVALATSTSMGLGGNNALLKAVASETRDVVAQVLSTPEGHLHVNGKRIVRVRDLLKSAADKENVDIKTYIELLRNGKLQGGGPELTVLSNVLRRPISIYELDDESILFKDNQNVDHNSNEDPEVNILIPSRCKIKCVGTFGDLFKDPCSQIQNPAVISGLLPGAYSWHIHLLIVDAGPNEKHACALLPQRCYL